MTKLCLIALTIALAACSQIVGFKDPKLDDMSGNLHEDAAIDSPPSGATCKPAQCPFGCDTAADKCREGKLWEFLSNGAYAPTAFGGADTPPNPRAGADAQCVATYTATIAALRVCNPKRVHAVLTVSTADSIGTMATTFQIPTDVTVNRAADDVVVSTNWLEFTDLKPPRVAPSLETDTNLALVWSGSTTSNCKGWTSTSTVDSGVRGDTRLTAANWLSRGSTPCDPNTTARLLCVCWAGGE